MSSRRIVQVSKFLSLVLRHRPEKLGLRLDAAGWVGVEELLAACRQHGCPLGREELERVVAENDKQRFAFDETRQRLRASQGHSVAVALGYTPATPPETLFHGTVARFLESIRREGLVKGKRHHVHLSADAGTAAKVGARRGSPVVLAVDAGGMQRAGFAFFRSENGVWLTERVPPEFLRSAR